MAAAAGDGAPGRAQATRSGSEAKKRGAGGKFTWGAMLSDTTATPPPCDRADPNYDSDEDAVVREVPLSGGGGASTGAATSDGGADDGASDGAEIDEGERTHSAIVLAVKELKEEVCALARALVQGRRARKGSNATPLTRAARPRLGMLLKRMN